MYHALPEEWSSGKRGVGLPPRRGYDFLPYISRTGRQKACAGVLYENIQYRIKMTVILSITFRTLLQINSGSGKSSGLGEFWNDELAKYPACWARASNWRSFSLIAFDTGVWTSKVDMYGADEDNPAECESLAILFDGELRDFPIARRC